MSSASAAITAGYIRMRCLSAINIADLHSYALQNSGTHRCQIFVYPPHLPPLPLSYIHTHCLSAVNIADLHSYALQNLVGMHRCQTFVCAPRQPSLPLATFIPAAHLPSTSLTSIRTHCRTLVRIVVRHLYILRVCCHYRWLHSYALLVCCQHRRPPFVRIAELRYVPLSDICISSASAAITAVLHSYALLVCCQHHRPLFVHVAEPDWYAPQSDIFISSASAAITAGYIHTRCSSAVNIAKLCSYALQNLVCMCCCPTFVRAAPLPSTSLSYIRTRCSSAIYIADLRTYALQNLIGIHDCPTFVRAARLPSTSPTAVRTRCRTSSVCTAVLHSYALLVCPLHR